MYKLKVKNLNKKEFLLLIMENKIKIILKKNMIIIKY